MEGPQRHHRFKDSQAIETVGAKDRPPQDVPL